MYIIKHLDTNRGIYFSGLLGWGGVTHEKDATHFKTKTAARNRRELAGLNPAQFYIKKVK